jgi:hypothetical protein
MMGRSAGEKHPHHHRHGGKRNFKKHKLPYLLLTKRWLVSPLVPIEIRAYPLSLLIKPNLALLI